MTGPALATGTPAALGQRPCGSLGRVRSQPHRHALRLTRSFCWNVPIPVIPRERSDEESKVVAGGRPSLVAGLALGAAEAERRRVVSTADGGGVRGPEILRQAQNDGGVEADH